MSKIQTLQELLAIMEEKTEPKIRFEEETLSLLIEPLDGLSNLELDTVATYLTTLGLSLLAQLIRNILDLRRGEGQFYGN